MGKNHLLLAIVPLLASLAACSATVNTTTPSSPGASPGSGSSATAPTKSRLDTVISRGKLMCGVSGDLPGFSFVDQTGKYSGLDVDFCKALAVALFDDPEKIEYRNLTAKERFEVLKAGDVDILSRNSTWTASRDTSLGLEFVATIFYDGQGMMVRKDANITKLEDLAGKSICVETGTTTELNLADQMRKLNVEYKPLVFENGDANYAAYAQGRCEGVTSDRSQLAGRRSTLPKPDEHQVLDVVMSKEPLAPVVVSNDSRWADVVKWTVFTLINADELGITSKNIDEKLKSTDPNVKRFLGLEGTLGAGMGLPKDFAVKVIKKVGSYGEIYDRNVGTGSKLNLPRGINKLWNDGGLMYSPPFR
jgi:general L-amino acid transport system substrate-binding protein